MPLVLVGISHKTAPVELREKISFTLPEIAEIFKGITTDSPARELTIVSTCNRSEIYIASENDPLPWCTQFLEQRFGHPDLSKSLYIKNESETVQHLFQVASGLDSLVLGETEILKQVKDSYLLAQKSGRTGKLLNILFQRALYVGKMVRTHTGISQGSVSVGSVAVSLGEKIFGDLRKSTVLLFGAGEMAEISARCLLSRKVKRMLVANRTWENAVELARKFKGEPLSLPQGLEQLLFADIVLTSAAAPEPIITRKVIEEVMVKRQNRSLFLIDIAVPRNIDASVHKMDNVYLYNIDDLESIVTENLKTRTAEIEKADQIVQLKTREFMEWYGSLKSGQEKSLKHRADFARDNLS